MQLGMIVLYVLFVPVGLWLLTEAMWQHGAPFRYRVLALIGFGGVVVGVAMGNSIVSGAGGVCFVVGQLLVTRQVRRGYYHGWTVRFGRKRARRARHGRPTPAEVAADPGTQDFVGYGEYPQYGAYEHAYEQGEFPAPAYDTAYGTEAEYDTGESDRYLYGEGDVDGAAPARPDYAPAYPEYAPDAHDGYGQQDAYAPQDGYAPAGYGQGGYGQGGYEQGGYGQDAYAQGAYPQDAYAPGGDGPAGSGEFPTQAFPMSSDTTAAPIPAPMSPPPGWAEAPTANRPGTDERFG